MDKKYLKSIDRRPIPQSIIDLIRHTEEKNIPEYLIRATVVDDLLLVDFFSTNRTLEHGDRHIYRSFIGREEYITVEYLPGDKYTWRTASLENLGNVFIWNRRYWPIMADLVSRKIILDYFGAEEDPIETIMEHQKSLMAKKLDVRHQKILAVIDKAMKDVPALPENFEEWVEEEALFHSRYLVYKAKKGKGPYPAHCTHCRSEVMLEHVANKETGVCPKCHTEAVMKPEGRFKTIYDEAEAGIFQRVPEGVMLRQFKISKNYTLHSYLSGADEERIFHDYRKPELNIFEKARVIYHDTGLVKYFEYRSFMATGVTRWCMDQGRWPWGPQAIYTDNLTEVIKGSRIQYSAIDIFVSCTPHMRFNINEYINTYYQGPALEYLVKLGLYNLTKDLTDGRTHYSAFIDIKTDGPLSIRKLPRDVLKRAIALDVDSVGYVILNLAEKYKVKVEDKDIPWIRVRAEYHHEDFFKLAAQRGTVHQLVKYLNSQDVDGIKGTRVLYDYLDYIKMATALGWDMTNEFVLFPRELMRAHDNAMVMTKVEKSKEDEKAIREAHQRLSEAYGYEDKDYIVKVPTCVTELIREGHDLHHCVGSYVKRVASGRTVIVFLRKKQDPYQPYITIEINPDSKKVIQARGSHNTAPEKEDAAFIEKYKSKVLNKATKTIAV